MFTCALGQVRCYVRCAVMLCVLVAALTTGLFSVERVAAQDGGAGLVDSSPPPRLEIFKWDPDTQRWIDCTITPQHVACRFNGVIPVPVGPSVIIPVDVDVDVSCGSGSFSLVGSAQLPQMCSRLSPCMINGFQVSCSASAGQITCEFFRQQDGQWVSVGGATISPRDILEVVVDCAGRLATRIRRFVQEHVTICPADTSPPSFPIGDPNQPQLRCKPLLEIRF